jgi:hypothetical protein
MAMASSACAILSAASRSDALSGGLAKDCGILWRAAFEAGPEAALPDFLDISGFPYDAPLAGLKDGRKRRK